MNHLSLALDLPLNGHHTRPEHDPSPLFEQAWPYDDVGNACFILDGDKHHAFGASRLLSDKHQSGSTDKTLVPGIHCICAGDDPSGGEISAKERERMRPQRQADMGVVLKSPVLAGVRVEGLADAPQMVLTIDREKANTFGVAYADINRTISASLGSSYVNDFPNNGRMQRVTVQADADRRADISDVMKLSVRNSGGDMVSLSAFTSHSWTEGATQLVGYNGFLSVRVSGQAAPGYSSGDAITEMERLATDLPPGFGFEWTGQTLQEIQSGAQVPMLLGLSCLLVFLCLAALYESWAIPLSVMLVIPLGIIGSVGAVLLRDMPNDVYFKVGLITIIGLSAKNAILIIEFAKDLRAEGKPIIDAVVEAAHLRFRPIIMTSLAFMLGVVPLVIASGAGSAAQRAIGTGVLGGMLTATILAVFFVPVFFVYVMKWAKNKSETGQQSSKHVLVEE